jgi:hypothetical protein
MDQRHRFRYRRALGCADPLVPSPAPNTRDLFVVQTEYNVPQLTPQRAEITFGLQYGEMLPSISPAFSLMPSTRPPVSQRLHKRRRQRGQLGHGPRH